MRTNVEAFCSLQNPWRGRIVAVFLDETAIAQCPEALREAKAIRFTLRDEAAKTERTLPQPARYDPLDPYWKALLDVADGIWRILEQLQRPSDEPLTPVAVLNENFSALVPVYLAEATDDLLNKRERLLRDFKRWSAARNLEVEPQDPADGNDVLARCSDAMARSKISIHLISDVPGRPWGKSSTRVRIQVEEALKRNFSARPICGSRRRWRSVRLRMRNTRLSCS